jgi:hypothetical protein
MSGPLGAIVDKLKSWLQPATAGGPAEKADTAAPAERESSTNAQPEGASDEPWPGA